MAYASRSGRAATSASSPNAFAVCDRCSRWHNHKNLRWQFDWRGASIQNIRLLVCDDCYDRPNPQQRAIVLPADPVPIIQPRIEPFLQDETDYQTVSAPTVYDPATGLPISPSTTFVTQNGQNLTTQVIGCPESLDQAAVMPFNGVTNYGIVLPILSVTADGTNVISVTCSAVHNMTTNGQISAEGLISGNGFYSVVVTTATAFTYAVYAPISAGSLLTNSTRIVTADVGIPRGYDTIPITGCSRGNDMSAIPSDYLLDQDGNIITDENGNPIVTS